MSGEIKEGSKVRLKSGGPEMMVTSVGESGWGGGGSVHAYVTWFNAKQEVMTSDFPLTVLEVLN